MPSQSTAAPLPPARDAAMRVTEAALDVLRTRHARTLLLEGLAHGKCHQPARRRGSDWDQLGKLDRYKRGALSRRNKAIHLLDEVKATRDHSAPGIAARNWQNEPNGEVPCVSSPEIATALGERWARTSPLPGWPPEGEVGCAAAG